MLDKLAPSTLPGSRSLSRLIAGVRMAVDPRSGRHAAGGWRGAGMTVLPRGCGLRSAVQPDLCQMGRAFQNGAGGTADHRVGKRYCPHYLGGGMGLSPRRCAGCRWRRWHAGSGYQRQPAAKRPCWRSAEQTEGMACLGDAPGLGYEPDLEPLRKYRVC